MAKSAAPMSKSQNTLINGYWLSRDASVKPVDNELSLDRAIAKSGSSSRARRNDLVASSYISCGQIGTAKNVNAYDVIRCDKNGSYSVNNSVEIQSAPVAVDRQSSLKRGTVWKAPKFSH